MCIPLGEPSCFSYNHTLTKNYFFLFSTMMQLVGVLDNNTLLFGSLYFPDPCPLLGSQPPPWPPICIYRPCPKFVFTNFGPQLVFTGPDQNFYIYRHWSLNCIYQLWPRLQPPICIYQSRSRFYYYYYSHQYYHYHYATKTTSATTTTIAATTTTTSNNKR